MIPQNEGVGVLSPQHRVPKTRSFSLRSRLRPGVPSSLLPCQFCELSFLCIAKAIKNYATAVSATLERASHEVIFWSVEAIGFVVIQIAYDACEILQRRLRSLACNQLTRNISFLLESRKNFISIEGKKTNLRFTFFKAPASPRKGWEKSCHF